jgi:hypothetical protein
MRPLSTSGILGFFVLALQLAAFSSRAGKSLVRPAAGSC